MGRKTLFMIVLLILPLSFVLCEEKTKWININVIDPKEEANVQIHLPLSVMDAAVKAVNTEEMHLGKVKIPVEKAEIDFSKVFQELKKAPDGDYVKIDSKDANVLITKKKEMIYINVSQKTDEKANVEIKLPAAILDALKLDENNELDISNIFSTLASFESGDLVSVKADGTDIRIWIE